MNIDISEEDICIAVKKYIVDLANRIKDEKRFTKFDSENDVFLGIIGEIAFKNI